MPMPHRTFAQVAKRRLQGTEGSERVRVINGLLAELPDYRNGPYADLRKWLQGELERTRMRAKVVHRDSLAVRREGAAQVALVGAPNAGKSSLLQALSEIQIKTGDYAFTTLRPVPALTRIRGVLVQLVEIPGLIEGAADGRGGGKALLGVLRNADAIVFCQAAGGDPAELRTVLDEVAAAGIEKPALLAATKLDDAAPGDLDRLASACPDLHGARRLRARRGQSRRLPRCGLGSHRSDPRVPAARRRRRRRARRLASRGPRSSTWPTRSTTSWPRRAVVHTCGGRLHASTVSASVVTMRSLTATPSRSCGRGGDAAAYSDAVTMHYEVKGSGPAVVLLHDGIVDSRVWKPQWESFAERYRLLRCDLAGFGRSPIDTVPVLHASDVSALLDDLGISSAGVVGCSLEWSHRARAGRRATRARTARSCWWPRASLT